MQDTTQPAFRETGFSGWAKWLRLCFSACFLTFCLVLLLHPDATVRNSGLGLGLTLALCLTGLYDVVWVFRQRLCWNTSAIYDRGVFWRGKSLSWTTLSAINNSMQRRATFLEFGKLRRVKVYWGYDAHREIVELAERKLKENA